MTLPEDLLPRRRYARVRVIHDFQSSMLDVLVYLFEHHIQEGEMVPWVLNNERSLARELQQEGFPLQTVRKALGWLRELEALQDIHVRVAKASPQAYRPLTSEESIRFNLECQDFLIRLQEKGVLNWQTREWVIDRALSLHNGFIHLFQLKWVCLLVLSVTYGHTAVDCVEILELLEENGGQQGWQGVH